ncbi:MAG: hypothetical protein COT35_09360 [Nitrospirae bacterium CG08_land_8_20_14_0_20_52_24]|nr:MAG: hypothetical protein COT35_09360 [Nitrospirae bacterium CG08_land_8_20_14_0_20_52_24]PIV85202.1 MAG: hypothetical protein COW52_03525 [Nitrospirae bacterium CG17_big_fil_post_rev_8_21_14_2_50_50_9]PIW84647.1 MAG: hypothetical protein COZ95_08745 [Nitrospirae bacterium CG_4_8_14_3_um_filter_50_41]
MKFWKMTQGLLFVTFIVFQACNQANQSGRAKQDAKTSGKSADPAAVVAYVNNSKITRGDIEQRFQMLHLDTDAHEPSKTEMKGLLTELIKEELLLQEAKRRNIHKKEELQARLRQYEKRLIVEELKKDLLDKVQSEKIDDKEVSQYFETYRDQFDIPSLVKLRQIVVADKVTAGNLFNKLTKDDSSFAEMARRYSTDAATKERGGLIGVYRKGTKEKAFEDAVLGIKEPMQFAPVFKTEAGYHIVQLLERREGISRRLQDVEPLIRRRISIEKEKKVLADILSGLEKTAKLKIVEDTDAERSKP